MSGWRLSRSISATNQTDSAIPVTQSDPSILGEYSQTVMEPPEAIPILGYLGGVESLWVCTGPYLVEQDLDSAEVIGKIG